MTWVKVCGITSREALDAAIDAGTDAIGLVLHRSSPRVLDVDVASGLAARSSVPAFIVTVDLPPDRVLELAHTVGAAGVQNHGEHATEAANAAVRAGLQALRPVSVGSGVGAVRPPGLDDRAIPLFDTAHGSLHGGTGTSFDWGVLTEAEPPFVVAGGLGPDNVRSLVEAIDPYGVDASSRLETAPGIKDPDTIRSFVREAHGR